MNPSLTLWRSYLELCKPQVVLLLLFTAFVGMFLSPDFAFTSLTTIVCGLLGIALAASAGAAFNHVIDSKTDEIMARTRGRPLPSGKLTRRAAVIFAGILCGLSMLLLSAFVNTLTAILTIASMVGYAVIYTVLLKPATPQNIVIGGAAGAMPPVLGWTAVSGALDTHALLLFLIIFAWTPPHFWALALHRRHDYARASIPMLPNTHGVAFTRVQIMLYTILVFISSLLPFVTQLSGWLYFSGAIVLGLTFIFYAFKIWHNPSSHWTVRTFHYSIHYLFLLFLLLMVDHYWLLRAWI